MRLEISSRELATILAALRVYQTALIESAGDMPDPILDIATHCDSHERMEVDEIDALCERINL